MSDTSTLPPWDAVRYFRAVSVRKINLTATPVKVANADPSRVYIGFSPGATFGGGHACPQPTVDPEMGYWISATFPTVEFFQYSHGPLTSCEWFASGNSGGALNVIEVFLDRWPSADVPNPLTGIPDAATDVDCDCDDVI